MSAKHLSLVCLQQSFQSRLEESLTTESRVDCVSHKIYCNKPYCELKEIETDVKLRAVTSDRASKNWRAPENSNKG